VADRITLAAANRLIEAAFAKGADLGLKPLGAAVFDAGGHCVAFQRQDRAAAFRFQVSAGKAAGALMMNMSSRKIAEMAAARPTFIQSLGTILPHGPIPAAGGILIVDGEGHVIGAVAVTGDTPDNDEMCAYAGIEAAGLMPQP